MTWRWLVLVLLLGSEGSNAYQTTIERRQIDYPPSLARRYQERDSSSGNENIGNVQNSQYVANITVGRGAFTVILDTGSSDLWVTGTVPNSTDTGTHASISYAIGEASGNIHTAQVTFSDFTVQNQAFIDVQDSSSFGSIAALGINGLAGLGPGFSSVVRNAIGTKGDTLLDNIFQLNKTTSNFITFLLSRKTNTENLKGEFTISQVISGYENVTNQPQLPVQELSNSSRTNQHWTTLLDSIVGPDGKKTSIRSIVKNTPNGKLVTVLDSGFTLPQVPRTVSDAIYGRVQGAEYDTTNGWWLIPCGQELNISVVFGGQAYHVHPLDTSSSDFDAKFSSGSAACVGTFQPISTAFSLGGEFDTIMGEGFLRNTYTLLNWGDFVDESSAARGSPYIQLLPITDPVHAHQEFVKARLNGVDTTGDSQYKLLSHGKSSPVSKGERVQHLEGFAFRNRYKIAAAGVAVFVVLVGIIIFCSLRRRRATRRARGLGYGDKGGIVPLGSTSSLAPGGPPDAYHSVSDPRSAPLGGSFSMHDMSHQRDPYYRNS